MAVEDTAAAWRSGSGVVGFLVGSRFYPGLLVAVIAPDFVLGAGLSLATVQVSSNVFRFNQL